ncbi:MAG: hexose kinase [Candidatus Nanosalina sp.]
MILTVTFNPAVDHTIEIEEDLTDEKVSRTSDSKFSAGGNGINVAEYLTALGDRAEATGPVGGFTGEFLKNTLTEEAVKSDFVDTNGLTRLNETILADGEEYKINQEGPKLGDHVVRKVIDRIEEADPEYVLVAGSLPPGLDAEDVDRIAKKFNGETVADLHGDVLRQLEEEYLFAKPNREELEEAVQTEVNSFQDAVEAAKKLKSEQNFEKVFASLGEDGVVLVTEERTLQADILPVEVADTVGAGDALVSGILSGLSRGLSWEDSLRRGMAVSRKVVSVEGTSMPKFEKVHEYSDKVEIEEI